MKIQILFIIACFWQTLTATTTTPPKNPRCRAVTSDESVEQVQFTFVLDRSANRKFYKRYVYLLKQLACMIPKNQNIEISLFSYSLHSREASIAQSLSRKKFEEAIFSTGYSQESLNYNFCTRFKMGLETKATDIKNYFDTLKQVHIIVPIVASAEDASLCSMPDVWDDFIQNYTRSDDVHFHGIYFDATADPIIKQMGQIAMDVPDINVIKVDERSMVKPPNTYTRAVKPILEAWQSFLDETIQSTNSQPPPPQEDEPNRNVTFSAAELYQVDGPHEHLLIILILIMIIFGLLMIIASLCLWYFMRRDSQQKIRESKSRETATTGGTPRSTPPRVSLSGMDSIDEFYIEPSAEIATQTPQTKTPTADKTPKNPSFERMDVSERKNVDVEQGGGGKKVRRGGARKQKAPADFRID